MIKFICPICGANEYILEEQKEINAIKILCLNCYSYALVSMRYAITYPDAISDIMLNRDIWNKLT